MEIKDLSEEELKEVYNLTGVEFYRIFKENGLQINQWCKDYGLSYTNIYIQREHKNKMNLKAVTCLIDELTFNTYYISLKLVRDEIKNENTKKENRKNEKS